eukprot:355727-Ditylum_brightwellii.AAC.1
MDGIKQCGPGNCRWCTHVCAGDLVPYCVSKLKYVPAHEQVGADFSHDCIFVDVCVHGDSICSEDLGIVWKCLVLQLLLQLIGALDEAFLKGCNGL